MLSPLGFFAFSYKASDTNYGIICHERSRQSEIHITKRLFS